MELRTPAKINLTLEVLGQRQDGYHEIRSVMLAVGIADRVLIEPAPSLTLETDWEGVAAEDNLMMKAARLLQKEYAVKAGARIRLHKMIPVSAGLGGGSSDAAATLRGLNQLWELGLAPKDLEGLASRLGSDVPFFIQGGTALAQGRGEVLTPLPDVLDRWYILAYMPVDVPNKTAELYSRTQPKMYTAGDRSKLLAQEISMGLSPAPHHYFNVFETIAFSVFPGLREFYAEFDRTGAPSIRMSGSGPTLYTPVESEASGRDFLQKCDRRGLPACLVKSIARHV